MMDLAATFSGIALNISASLGGPFFPGVVIDQGTPVEDAGGSIITPDTPVERVCQVQIDQATEAMRQAEGYTDGDVRFFILAATLTGSLNTDAQVRVDVGPHAGTWMVSAIKRDPMGVAWSGRGRRA